MIEGKKRWIVFLAENKNASENLHNGFLSLDKCIYLSRRKVESISRLNFVKLP